MAKDKWDDRLWLFLYTALAGLSLFIVMYLYMVLTGSFSIIDFGVLSVGPIIATISVVIAILSSIMSERKR